MPQFFQFFSFIRVCLTQLLVLALAIGLSGCSAARLAYNNTPDMAYWWLDNYLDFNDPQSLQVRAELLSLQSWHRQYELPLYVKTLEQLQQLSQSEVTPSQVCSIWTDLKLRLRATLEQAEPAAATLAATITPEQIDHLARQLSKRNQKWRLQWLDVSPPERSERRLKQLMERTEMLYGPLEQQQIAALRDSVAVSVFDAGLGLHELQRRQRDMVQTLRRLRTGAAEPTPIRAALHALLERSLSSPNDRYRSYANKMLLENCNLLAALHNSSTSAQRHKALQALGSYADDARALMTVGP